MRGMRPGANAASELPSDFAVQSSDYVVVEGFFVTPLNLTIDG